MDAVRGRGRRGRGRGFAPGRGPAPRGRGRGLGGRGGRGRGDGQDHAQPAGGAAGDEHPLLNFDVPNHLLNQGVEVDDTNDLLSKLYNDMNDVRDAITEMRELVVPNQIAYDQLIQEQLDGYREMRKFGEDLRNKIRMAVGAPFDEPDGFDIMP